MKPIPSVARQRVARQRVSRQRVARQRVSRQRVSCQRVSCQLMLVALLAALSLPRLTTAADPPWLTGKPIAHWIWDADGADDGQQLYFRKTFSIEKEVAGTRLLTSCDNRMTLWINGEEVGSSRDWPYPITRDVSEQLQPGENTIAIAAKNDGGVAALVLKLGIDFQDETTQWVVTDETWQIAKQQPGKRWFAGDLDPADWQGKVARLNPLGAAPWGIPGRDGNKPAESVTAAETIQVPDGFVVDHLYTVPRETQGSWVALTSTPDGRLIACDQADKGAFFVAIDETSEGPAVEVTPIEVNQPQQDRRLSGAQGLLWAFDALWFHKNGGHLFRISDSDGDGKLDAVATIPGGTGGGEHGNHAVITTEDGSGIYMDGGNHAPLGELAASRVPTWKEDLLLPRMWDANGHARGKRAPGGWVTRLDPKTEEQTLVCIGFRNQYDIALNRHGDLFTYDADMEWDLGMPWYRPTRICQVVSGGDYGWRSGTGKWPTYYEDSLPPVVEIGPGSPTGMVAGIGAKFPARYQQALFGLDWTFGTIYAIHLEHHGAGYRGTSEAFATGTPLPVTDAIVGTDGALYFTVGGRGTQSALYRIRYEGPESTAAVTESSVPAEVATAHQQRQRLERFHGKTLSEQAARAAVAEAWPFLGSEDRFLRAAARVAVETQPVELWADRVVAETDPQRVITSAVALARMGEAAHQAPLLQRLLTLDVASLSEPQLLGLLRGYALTCIRLGKPTADQRTAMIAQLDPLLPHENDDVNTELVRVLTYLEAPSVIAKTMALIEHREPPEIPDWSELASRNAGYGGTVQQVLANHPPSREIGYALMLRNLRDGWTIDQRRAYFTFLNTAAKASGGASFPGFMRNIREEALANCSDAERLALQDITGEQYDPVPDFAIPEVQGPGRQWTIPAARSQAARDFQQADFERGRGLYFAADCGKCHRFSGLGGNIGPDLTTIPRKFDVNYLIEHIIHPSRVISDQYQSSILVTDDGRTLTGLMSQADGKVIVYPSDLEADPIELEADQVLQVKPSPISQMPKGLIDGLNPEELRDLLAYLMSGGDPQNERVYGRR